MINILGKRKNKWRKLFPVFKKHPNLIYLDNAASTQKPKTVID
jgi:selenocysteine lyase/cysteine desulfurase